MTVNDPVREFLMTRRAKVQPEDVGLPRGARRRVSGLRREEVAALAGVSGEYYVQIERGELAGVSDEVLLAVARALRLDEAETSHLLDLARAKNRRSPRTRRTSRPTVVPVAVQALLDAMVGAIAVVQDGRLDLVATNALGRAFYTNAFETTDRRPNLARYVFLDPRSRDFFLDWDRAADDVAAMLHVEAGRSPYARELTDLVGELATRSAEFRTRWAAHDVRLHRTGLKRVRHPEVGEMVLQYAGLEVPEAAGLVVYGYTPARDETRTVEALRLLASLAVTPRGAISAPSSG